MNGQSWSFPFALMVAIAILLWAMSIPGLVVYGAGQFGTSRLKAALAFAAALLLLTVSLAGLLVWQRQEPRLCASGHQVRERDRRGSVSKRWVCDEWGL